MPAFRLVICGSRHWQDRTSITLPLSLLIRTGRVARGDLVVVHGGALGADRHAEIAARHCGVVTESWPADWSTYGKKAGPIRNSAMMKSGIDEVWAFKDDFDFSLPMGRGHGTEDAARIAMKLGIPTFLHWHEKNVVYGTVRHRRQLVPSGHGGVVAAKRKGHQEDVPCLAL